MDKTFRVKLSAWYEALEAYKALESAMACKIEEQYDMLSRLENVWYGKSAGEFQSKYREMLETGTYAESYKHIGEIRMLLEEGLPELVCMAAKCEQLPEQLACDEYVVPITRYAYSPHYNAGHVMLDDDYAPFVDQMCDRIQEVNQEARNLLDDIMAQCGDLIDFSAEKLENETVYRKINRVGNYKRAFDEYASAVRQFDENMQTDLSFVNTRYFDRNSTLTYGQPGELVREPVKTSIDSLATNQYLLSLLHKKDNELTETEKEYINLCYKETLENLDKETWEKILTSTEEISGIEKFNNAILEFTKDFDGLREKVGDYLSRSLEQIICGSFTEEVTLLGTIGQVLLGIVGVDLPCDIRDLAADFCKIGNGESVSFMQMGVDVIALIPIIGSAKYLDEAGTLLKKSDVVDDIVKHVDELVDGVKGSTEVIDDVAESVIKSGRKTINGLNIIDGKVDGKIPLAEYEKYRVDSVHNVDSNIMTLGKYEPTIRPDGTKDFSVPGPGAYTVKAGDTTYFSLGTKWDKITDTYCLDAAGQNMFDYFNKPALDDAVSAGKEIRFSHNPEAYGECALKWEWDYLQEKHGYFALEKRGDFWYAIK